MELLFKEKSEFKDIIKDLKATHGFYVRYIHCDENARENEDFDCQCKQEGMDVKFE